MYIRVEGDDVAALQAAGVQCTRYGEHAYAAVAELKASYDALRRQKLDVGKLVRFDKLVFSADMAALRQVR